MKNETLKTIVQIGIVVEDIEATIATYADFFGVEKPQWFWTGPQEESRTIFQGEKTEARAKLAFFDIGSTQIELIEPDHHQSSWRRHLDERGEGPHHIAFIAEGDEGKKTILEEKGFTVQQQGEFVGGRYALLDTVKELKVLVELLEYDK